MYSLEELHNLVLRKKLPNENKVSLKLYIDYYDNYIKNSVFNIGNFFHVEITPSQVPHIMDIHAFYDSKKRDKKIKFRGAFTTIQAYRNIKTSVINLDTLRTANEGKVWKNNTIKNRVLGFVFLKEALLKGEWYTFNQSYFKGRTNVQAEYIVMYQIESIVYNFCITKAELGPHFCISNLVTYTKSNGSYYISNQEKLKIERVIETKKNNMDKTINVVCHDTMIRSMLHSNRHIKRCEIDKHTHNRILKKHNSFNSFILNEEIESYHVTYLRIDSGLSKDIN